jgi:predicted enzyme related to lactoylglutathione lyase
MTSDTKAAESFNRSVIGWDANDSGMTDRSYTIFSLGPRMVCGLMPVPEEARAKGVRPHWSGYIAVDDVDAYAERVKAAGGAVHRAPEDIPGVGRFAVAADPHGAVQRVKRSGARAGGARDAGACRLARIACG